MARDNDIFKYKRSAKRDEVVPTQQLVILEVIKAAGAGGITRLDLIKELKTVLKTKQTPERILSFYRGPLVAGGFVTITKDETKAEPKEPKAKKKAASKAKPKAKAKKKVAKKKGSKKKAAETPAEDQVIEDQVDDQVEDQVQEEQTEETVEE